MYREAVRHPIIIGHSLGARVALQLAASGEAAFERVILIDMHPEPGEQVGAEVERHLDILCNGAPDEDLFLRQIQERLPLADPDVLREVIPMLARAKGGVSGPGMSLPFDPEIKRLLSKPSESDAWSHLANLDCPVTIIRGGYSSVLDEATAQKMATRTRHQTQLLTVPKAGHALALEQPRALANAIFKAITGKSVAVA
jgi:pimeloyl-ACP methyl ester carboxylesterase